MNPAYLSLQVLDEEVAGRSENAPAQWLPWGHNADLKLVTGGRSEERAAGARRRLLSMSMSDSSLTWPPSQPTGRRRRAHPSRILVGVLLGVGLSSLGLSCVAVWLKVRRDKAAGRMGGKPCISTADNEMARVDWTGQTGPVQEIWMQNGVGENDGEDKEGVISDSHIRVHDVEDSACNPTKV